jgi:hypothetical protein
MSHRSRIPHGLAQPSSLMSQQVVNSYFRSEGVPCCCSGMSHRSRIPHWLAQPSPLMSQQVSPTCALSSHYCSGPTTSATQKKIPNRNRNKHDPSSPHTPIIVQLVISRLVVLYYFDHDEVGASARRRRTHRLAVVLVPVPLRDPGRFPWACMVACARPASHDERRNDEMN